LLGPLLALTLWLVPGRAHAIEPIRDRWEFLDPRAPNLVFADALILGNFAGVGLGYRRGLGRHASVGAMFEYAYPNPGYGQLLGFGHTLELTGWIKRPWNGLFVSLAMTLGHQALFRVPELHTLALGATVSIGWSWDVTAHINVGVSSGVRRMGVVQRSTEICTLPRQCIFTDEEFRPRFALTFAYRF
jgi:hypothetical protein